MHIKKKSPQNPIIKIIFIIISYFHKIRHFRYLSSWELFLITDHDQSRKL